MLAAVERGVNFLNWPGLADGPSDGDGLSRAVASLGPRREDVVVCAQFGAATAADAAEELRAGLGLLGTDYVDVLTSYYVERRDEWQALLARYPVLGQLDMGEVAGNIERASLLILDLLARVRKGLAKLGRVLKEEDEAHGNAR